MNNREALQRIADMCPATCETSLAHEMAEIAQSALASQAAELSSNPLQLPAQAQQESQWISVEERLPDAYKPVLVATNFGDVYTCRLPVIIAKNSKEESSVGKRERFTHWMDIPPAPEGEKNDQ